MPAALQSPLCVPLLFSHGNELTSRGSQAHALHLGKLALPAPLALDEQLTEVASLSLVGHEVAVSASPGHGKRVVAAVCRYLPQLVLEKRASLSVPLI